MRILFFLSSLLISSTIFAQNMGDWKNYTNMKDVAYTLSYENNIWAATGGGAFLFNSADSTYQQFTQSEGLSNQILTALTLDSENTAWFGARNGAINIYYPQEERFASILDIVNSDKKFKQINCLIADRDTIYACTDFGVSVFNRKNLTLDDTYQKLGEFPSETKVIHLFKEELLYVSTDEGIAIQKLGTSNLTSPDSWNSYFYGEEVPADTVSRILRFNGEIIAGTNKGILRFINNSWNSFLLSDKIILDIKIYNNELYILTDRSIVKSNGTSEDTILRIDNTDPKNFDIISENEFIIASAKGVIKANGTELKYYFPNGPASNLFNHLAVDSKGHLWSGTGKNGAGVGVYEFDGYQWINHNSSNTPLITSNDYHRVFAGAQNVYYCSWGFGFIQNNNGDLTKYDALNTDMKGISDDSLYVVISAVKEDAKINRWVLNYWSANRQVLAKITPNDEWTFYQFDYPYDISNTDLTIDLEIDQYGTKWFSVQTGTQADKGLFYFNENGIAGDAETTYGRLTSNDGLSTGLITALAVDQRGELWVGKSPGIDIIFNPSHPQASQIGHVRAFANQNVKCIAVDPINRKWIGTTEGLFVMSSDGNTVLAHYTSKNSPIPFDDIKSVAIDAETGLVYIGTDFGLSSLKTASVNAKQQFDEIFVYPNPYKIGDGKETILNIDGLIKNSSLKILTISGKLVREIDANTDNSPGGRIGFWDGKDQNGNFVDSGIYIIIAYDSDGSNVHTSKVAVLKK